MYALVAGTRWLTPSLIRVTLTGGELAGFEMPDATDAYINLALPPVGAPYGPIFDPADVRASVDKRWWPARRHYTVRSWQPTTRQLEVDFVVHGDVGVGGPWAAAAEPGDVLVFTGPGSGYRPDPSAAWHLMLGDESALPAIAASLEVLPADAVAVVRLVCDGPVHEITLDSPATLDVRWLHRQGEAADASLLLEATRALEVPPGRVQAFVHGEADEIRAIRRHLLTERGLTRADMSCSPYWRRDLNDETWRTMKREYVAAMEAEVP